MLWYPPAIASVRIAASKSVPITSAGHAATMTAAKWQRPRPKKSRDGLRGARRRWQAN
jgi:hypothetical protein